MVQLSHAVLLYKAHNIHRDERITFVTAPVLDPLSHLNTKLLVRCVGFSNGRAKESFSLPSVAECTQSCTTLV